jgi:hypothetical protein
MGSPFLFADRFSGAVVHLIAGSATSAAFTSNSMLLKCKMPATVKLTQAFSKIV